jgi:hypothetical protein
MEQSQKMESKAQEKSSEQRNKKLFPPSLCLKPDLIEEMYRQLQEDQKKETKKKRKPPKRVYIPENGGWTNVY